MRYEDRLIQLAYELMLHPQKLSELDELIDHKLKMLGVEDDAVLASKDPTLSDVSHFFDSAYKIYEGKSTSTISKKGLVTRDETTSWLLVDPNGRITQISEPATQT
ncbi:MAG: hypothetical protein AAFQ24_07150, partial [Pseudomonadota bacterium]